MTIGSITAASRELAEAGAPEIEITPEMVQAGDERRSLYEWNNISEAKAATVLRGVFAAMTLARASADT